MSPSGATPKPLGLCDDLPPSQAGVEEAITDAAALVLNSPANPTGAVQPSEVAHGFARLASEYNVHALPTKSTYTFVGTHCLPMDITDSEDVKPGNAQSKTDSMTGRWLGR